MERYNVKKRLIVHVKGGLIGLICFFSQAVLSPAHAVTTLLDKIDQLDSDYQTISAAFYQDSSRSPGVALHRTDTIEQLYRSIDKLLASSDEVAAIRLLHGNQSIVMNALDSKVVYKLIEILLSNNDIYMARKIFAAMKQEQDDSILSPIKFLFAKYYADRHAWEKAHDSLKAVFADLSPEDTAYAYLLDGVALQHLKKHREAITLYNKVSPSSSYYAEAQLNIAVASVRQGWWTDAELTIKKLTKNDTAISKNELINRLYVVLGYVLLRHEFYRDARDAFRHVALESRYADRALLGIGLAATSQGDYLGALNVFSTLKSKKTRDLSQEESHLLLPYIYAKLQQEVTVTAGYTEAISYYQKRINELKKLVAVHKKFSASRYDDSTSILSIGEERLNYGDNFPPAFMYNYHLLNELAAASKGSRLSGQLSVLLSKYDEAFQEITNALLQQRITYLESYVSQSRYGLAKFLDNVQGEAGNE